MSIWVVAGCALTLQEIKPLLFEILSLALVAFDPRHQLILFTIIATTGEASNGCHCRALWWLLLLFGWLVVSAR